MDKTFHVVETQTQWVQSRPQRLCANDITDQIKNKNVEKEIRLCIGVAFERLQNKKIEALLLCRLF